MKHLQKILAMKRMNDLSEYIDGKIELSNNVSVFSSGTGKDESDNTQDFNTTIQDSIAKFLFGGLSLVQLAQNGNFANGTANWAAQSGTTLTVVDGNFILTGNGNFQNIEVLQTLDSLCKENDNWFISYVGEPDNSESSGLAINVRGETTAGTVQFVTNTSYVPNQKNEVYGIVRIPSNAVGRIEMRIGHNYSSAATANGKVMEIDGKAGVFAINMTQCGYYDYLENKGYTDDEKKTIMLNLVKAAKWWYGRKDVINPRIRSVGKNLCPYIDGRMDVWENVVKLSFDGEFFNLASPTNLDGIPMTLGVGEYELSLVAQTVDASSYGVLVKNENDETIAVKYIGTAEALYSLDFSIETEGKYYLRFSIAFADATAKFKNLMIRKSATDNAYEEYKNPSLVQLKNTVLRSLPNGTRDEIYPENGRWYHKERIKAYMLQSADIDAVLDGVNMQRVRIYNTVFNGIATDLQASAQGKFVIGSRPETGNGNYDTAGYEGYFSQDASVTLLYENLGTYADLAAAQAALSGEEVLYELAEPVITDITDQVEGILEVFQNGTIYLESGTEESISVTGTSHVLTEDFNEVEEVWYLDGDDLVLLDEDTWTFTLATMTLSGLTDGVEYLVKGVPDGYLPAGTDIEYSFTTKDVIKSNSGGVLQNAADIANIEDVLAILIAGI